MLETNKVKTNKQKSWISQEAIAAIEEVTNQQTSTNNRTNNVKNTINTQNFRKKPARWFPSVVFFVWRRERVSEWGSVSEREEREGNCKNHSFLSVTKKSGGVCRLSSLALFLFQKHTSTKSTRKKTLNPFLSDRHLRYLSCDTRAGGSSVVLSLHLVFVRVKAESSGHFDSR